MYLVVSSNFWKVQIHSIPIAVIGGFKTKKYFTEYFTFNNLWAAKRPFRTLKKHKTNLHKKATFFLSLENNSVGIHTSWWLVISNVRVKSVSLLDFASWSSVICRIYLRIIDSLRFLYLVLSSFPTKPSIWAIKSSIFFGYLNGLQCLFLIPLYYLSKHKTKCLFHGWNIDNKCTSQYDPLR